MARTPTTPRASNPDDATTKVSAPAGAFVVAALASYTHGVIVPRRSAASSSRRSRDRDDANQVLWSELRPPLKALALRWFLTLGCVGVVAGVLFFVFTPEGQLAWLASGALMGIVGWAIFLMAILSAGFLALGIGRTVNGGLRRVSKSGIWPIVVAEAATAAAGATAAAAILAMNSSDVMRVLFSTFALTFLFTWAVVWPPTVQRFAELTGEGN